MMQSYIYFTVPLTDRFRKDRIWSVLCVCTLSRCTVGFDFENLGNIEVFVIKDQGRFAGYGIIISY